MRKNIEALINSGLSAYRVSKDTGIPNNTVVRIFSGEAKVDNITLKNAEILSGYWEGLDFVKDMGIIGIEGVEYYTFPADYYENEAAASKDGYYWDDEVDRWTKRIVDETTTIF
ncbi:hypothetical protein [Lysinibacillus sp. 54212]|uniref:hypothetical protein n=1 Tax=Lysinibacillus sp. 54212 TaxID=3119829 RepID=UPI002FC887EA